MEKDIICRWKPKMSSIVVLLSHKTNFNSKTVKHTHTHTKNIIT